MRSFGLVDGRPGEADPPWGDGEGGCLFAEPSITDFLENLRWQLGEAVKRAKGAIALINADHAKRGILHSSMTNQRITNAVKVEFDAGIEVAFGELKRAIRITKLDPKDLRQATLECLSTFLVEAKGLMASSLRCLLCRVSPASRHRG
jgi:hypothetical protein